MADIRVRVGQQNAVKVIAGATPGATGSQGTQGIQGTSTQGVAGSSQGTQGTQGLQGTQGVGSQGSQGLSGAFSGQGVQGLQGVGAQGVQGVQGSSSQGISGAFSGQGIQGLSGEIPNNLNVTNINATGIVTAYNFVGFSSGLTGINIGNTYYVSVDGNDTTNTGDGLNKAFRTIKKALEVATNGDNVHIGSGVFGEVFPLTIPQGVSIQGSGIRGTFIQPTEATKQNDCFLMNGETEVTDLTIGYMYEPGWAFRFAPNMKTNLRSPYIQRVTVLNRGTGITTADPYGFDTPHNPPTSYKAGRGVLIDGSVVDPTTLEPAMLFNECTFICPNNTALEMTNGARTEWVNCFSYFADKAIYGHSGDVGIGSTGKARIKVSGITTTEIPSAGDHLYYFASTAKSGTYNIVGASATITATSHGLSNNDRVYLDFDTSNNASDGVYRISGITSNTFNINVVAGVGTTSTGTIIVKEALGFGTISEYSSGKFILLGKGEGTFSTSSNRSSKQITVFGDAKISTEQKYFGASSAKFDGIGDYLQIASDVDYGFSTGDFTLECFVRPGALPGFSGYQSIIDLRDGTTSDIAPNLSIKYGPNPSIPLSYLRNLSYRVNNIEVILGTTNLLEGTWYHVAICRAGTSTKIYLNGVQQGTTYTDTNNYGTSKPVKIGTNPTLTENYVGFIDEIRISNSARYSGIGTFAVPSSAFTSDGNTKLLLHCDGDDGSVVFTDSTLTVQDVRVVSSVGLGTTNKLTATKISLADYQQFGADMRSIGSAAVFGNTGITADGLGVNFRLFAFNFGHIGSGGDFSQDESLVVQADEVIESNGGQALYVSIDQRGDFRVGNTFYVSETDGNVSFSQQSLNVSSFSNLDITDGTNTTTITPTSLNVANLQLNGNQIISTAGDIEINPSGISSTRVIGDMAVSGGDLQVGVSTTYGVVLTAPNGTKYRLIVNNSGALSTTPV